MRKKRLAVSQTLRLPPFLSQDSVRVTTPGSAVQEVQLFAGPLQPGNPRMIFIDHGESFDRDGIYGEDGRDY